jgi:hypothetical protein
VRMFDGIRSEVMSSAGPIASVWNPARIRSRPYLDPNARRKRPHWSLSVRAAGPVGLREMFVDVSRPLG